MEHLLETGDEIFCRINGKDERGYLTVEDEKLFFENSKTEKTEISIEDICYIWLKQEWCELLFYETTDEGYIAALDLD